MTVLVKDADSVLESAFLSRVASFKETHAVFQELTRRWLAYMDPESDVRCTELASAIDNARARLTALDDAFYVQNRFPGAEGQQRFEGMRAAVVAQLESASSEMAEINSAMDVTILFDTDRLHAAWKAADLEQARMLLRVVLHSVRLLPSRGRGSKSSWYELFMRCCFHWVGEKPQPLKIDRSRIDGVVRYLPESTELAA
ncbi:hypothetical protein OG735_28555 [Streptomyces sp. NBC_01210]|uniref:hypothetical protein n=1 Tax=Streptomyces sp. NBC_01210 TaxID=2903774 RepID=UPI002E1684BE|nr:hypothetical protein OG735_28555 [Streptomyces sp. NBC_01210]